MYLLDPSTTERYLRERGALDPQETVRVTELSGGVSNQVLLVERGRGDRFVLKQAREQLRVQQEWKCDVRRIWREMDVLRLCGEVLREANLGWTMGTVAGVPDVLFEDRQNFSYAMTAAPAAHHTWKEHLLDGELDPGAACVVGTMLGTIHARTWNRSDVKSLLDDRSFFEALRLDPYYRRVSDLHPSMRPSFEELITYASTFALALVHGDFSPKNLLVYEGHILLIDFEVGHFGDPAFDTGFCLSHLMLKGIARSYQRDEFVALAQSLWQAYALEVQKTIDPTSYAGLAKRTALNMAGCILARIDGKSPVNYLDEQQRAAARRLAVRLLSERPTNVDDAIAALRGALC